jgi:RNA polymerase sigma-70 factor (ECF subfamily)
MVSDEEMRDWFRREVLPLERSLTHFIRRNWRVADDVMDLRHDVYELAIGGAREALPVATRQYMFTIARNHLINLAKRSQIVSFELVADLETVNREVDMFEAERHLDARDTLRHMQAGLAKLTPRVREILQLRKIDGLNVKETAERLGIGSDAVRQQTVLGMRALTDHMAGGRGRIAWPQVRRRRDREGRE